MRSSDYINPRSVRSLPPNAHKIAMDIEASEIDWAVPANASITQQERIRQELAQAIEVSLNNTTKGSLTLARYRLRVDHLYHNPVWTLFPCFIYLTFLGCPLTRSEANVTLTLQVGSELFESQGRGKSFQGLYYNHHEIGWGYGAVMAATAEALKRIRGELVERGGH